jgi:hypothetical protein
MHGEWDEGFNAALFPQLAHYMRLDGQRVKERNREGTQCPPSPAFTSYPASHHERVTNVLPPRHLEGIDADSLLEHCGRAQHNVAWVQSGFVIAPKT